MANIDVQRKRVTSKIVYYGPGLSGKTENLQFLSTHLARNQIGDLEALPTRTDPVLYIDVLHVRPGGKLLSMDVTFQLVTVPGHAFYNRPRKALLKAADGVVFVADSRSNRQDANVDSLLNLTQNLQSYNLTLKQVPHVVQYNKRDLPDVLNLTEMRQALNLFGVPDFEAVATDGTGVLPTLKAIIRAVRLDLERRL